MQAVEPLLVRSTVDEAGEAIVCVSVCVRVRVQSDPSRLSLVPPLAEQRTGRSRSGR